MLDITISIINRTCKELFKESFICSLVTVVLYVEDLYKLLRSTPFIPSLIKYLIIYKLNILPNTRNYIDEIVYATFKKLF